MSTKTEAEVSQPFADLDGEGLLGSFPEGPRLVGTVCAECGTAMIGSRVVCSSCISRDVSRVALPTTGVLYSFTRLHVRGEGTRAMGYVDLDDRVRTLTDLRETATPLVPGLRVELHVDGDEWHFSAADGQ